MPFVLLAVVLVIPLVLIALTPLLLIQRYRMGTTRRLARRWVATLNVAAMAFSVGFFLIGAAVTNAWVPNAFTSALAGIAGGCALGVVGLYLSRWESTPGSLHYTPNRWLVLVITLLVTMRIAYGFWRGWVTVRSGADASWLTSFGVAESLAAGATVLGYYLAYSIGVRSRISKWEKRTLRRLA
jgi:hypothetical protein